MRKRRQLGGKICLRSSARLIWNWNFQWKLNKAKVNQKVVQTFLFADFIHIFCQTTKEASDPIFKRFCQQQNEEKTVPGRWENIIKIFLLTFTRTHTRQKLKSWKGKEKKVQVHESMKVPVARREHRYIYLYDSRRRNEWGRKGKNQNGKSYLWILFIVFPPRGEIYVLVGFESWMTGKLSLLRRGKGDLGINPIAIFLSFSLERPLTRLFLHALRFSVIISPTQNLLLVPSS